MYKYETVVRLRDTDAAGVVFFAAYFELAHDCYESFLDISTVIKEDDFIIPIVHAEADYAIPLEPGDEITIQMVLAKTGRCSFTLEYEIIKTDGTSAAKMRTIHAIVSKHNSKPLKIPEAIKEKLEAIQKTNTA